METITVKLTFYSDFTVGTGCGLPGVLDNTVIKTQDGVPFIPGTTLKGNIREKCQEIAQMFGLILPKESEPDKDRHSEIARIFGTPFIPAGVAFQSAFFHHSNLNRFRKYLTHGERHNKINPLTGTAQEDHFFSYETATRQLEFSFEIMESHISDYPMQDQDKALLIAGILFTDRIGAKKSRGRGKCSLEITNETYESRTVQEWVSLLNLETVNSKQ